MTRWVRALLFALIVSGTAFAAGSDDARAYFDIGAKAYQAGRYLDAVKAFEQAYRLSNRPGLLFSLGQAHRMEYFARNDPARLKDAVRYYQEYIAREPSGRRVAEATDALSKLRPLLPPDGGAQSAPEVTKEERKPQVMVSSPTPGVVVTFDNRRVSHPFISEVAPGKHMVKLSAPGFEDYTREIVVDAKNGTPPLDVPLVPRSALLTIRTDDGAEVSIDGRLQGDAPLPPLKVTAGSHFVAIVLNGRRAFSKRITLTRGQNATLDASLEGTGQRTVSWVLLGAGAGAVVAGGVLGFVALSKQKNAEDLKTRAGGDGNLSQDDLDRYDSLRQSRDDFRLAALISAGAGLGLGTAGLFLRSFDQPRTPLPPVEEAVPGERKPEASPPSMEMSITPFVLSHASGVSVRGAF
jgi:hypothetical protein